MNTLLNSGRYFYGLAFLLFGITQFITGMFVVGRAPTWAWATPMVVSSWAYLSGAILVAAGAAVLANKRAREAASIIGILIVVAPVIRYIPLILADKDFGGAWTAFFKSLALAGGSYIIAVSVRRDPTGNLSFFDNLIGTLAPAGRFLIALFFIAGGIQHFIFYQFVQTMIPAWIPGPLFWTYFAGIALIAAGIGLTIHKTTRLAAILSGLMIFTWMLILHIPRALADPENLNEWLGCMETLAFSGILFTLANLYRTRPGANPFR